MNAERLLKNAVIGMGILIFVLLGVVVWRIGTLADEEDAALPLSGEAADVSLDLAPGCRIADSNVAAGRLVIRTTGPAGTCDAVYLLDLTTGARVATITP